MVDRTGVEPEEPRDFPGLNRTTACPYVERELDGMAVNTHVRKVGPHIYGSCLRMFWADPFYGDDGGFENPPDTRSGVRNGWIPSIQTVPYQGGSESFTGVEASGTSHLDVHRGLTVKLTQRLLAVDGSLKLNDDRLGL